MVKLKIYDKDMQQDIENFIQICFKEVYANMGWGYDPAGRHSDIANICEAYMKNGCFWCLYDGTVLIGTVAAKNICQVSANGKHIELKRMFVLKEYQGKGYGRLLLETVIDYSRKNGFDKILLDTRIDFHAAIKLYRKNGFVEVPAYNDNTNADLFFELKL
ncbi:MAG: GNAT family N-acetyltransferase [Oscillospiraceae bacterium]|nr:GNAT family N-acetyltransferase [Oscillospiraceae bacterium]